MFREKDPTRPHPAPSCLHRNSGSGITNSGWHLMANNPPKDPPSLGLAPHPSPAQGPVRIREMSRNLPSGVDPEESEFKQKLLTAHPAWVGEADSVFSVLSSCRSVYFCEHVTVRKSPPLLLPSVLSQRLLGAGLPIRRETGFFNRTCMNRIPCPKGIKRWSHGKPWSGGMSTLLWCTCYVSGPGDMEAREM